MRERDEGIARLISRLTAVTVMMKAATEVHQSPCQIQEVAPLSEAVDVVPPSRLAPRP